MKKMDLGQTIGILANLGVVAGIVFLAVEIQQNNELLRTEARYHMLTNMTESLRDSYTNEAVKSGWIKVDAGEEVTAEERFALLRYNHAKFRRLEWEYQQYLEGLIDDANLPVQGWIIMLRTDPLMAEAWQKFNARYSENFRLFMEENIIGQ